MEGRSFIVQRKRMTGSLNSEVKTPVRKFQRQNPLADAARHLVDWQAVGRDGIPQAEKLDAFDRRVLALIVALAQKEKDHVANDPKDPLKVKNGVKPRSSVGAVRHLGLFVDFRLGLSRDQPLMKDKADHDPHGEGAAAKAKAVNTVARLIVHTKEFVDVENITLQTPTKSAAQYGQRLKGGSANAIVVNGNLIVTTKVQTFKHAPDVGFPNFVRGVSGSVGKQNDVLVRRHGMSPNQVLKMARRHTAAIKGE